MAEIIDYDRFGGNLNLTKKQATKDNCDYVMQFISKLGGSFGTGGIKTVGLIGTHKDVRAYMKTQKTDPTYTLCKNIKK